MWLKTSTGDGPDVTSSVSMPDADAAEVLDRLDPTFESRTEVRDLDDFFDAAEPAADARDVVDFFDIADPDKAIPSVGVGLWAAASSRSSLGSSSASAVVLIARSSSSPRSLDFRRERREMMDLRDPVAEAVELSEATEHAAAPNDLREFLLALERIESNVGIVAEA